MLRGIVRSGRGRLARIALATLAAASVAGCGGSPTSPTPPRPQLLCPADVAVSHVVGGTQAVIFTPPVQTAGTTPITIACSPASGSMFPVGTTTVRCTGTDAFNQVGTCSFNVVLTPLTLSALTFVAFGDSVTEGENSLPGPGGLSVRFVDVANAYPTKLRSKLQIDFPTQTTTVVNAGLGGEFLDSGIDRLMTVLAQHLPEALLLLHGYNDLLNGGATAAQDVVDGLEEMIRVARGLGVRYVFVSTITPGRPGPRQLAPAAVVQTNSGIRTMALAEGAYLVDSFNALVGREATLVSNDGLHLTPAGNDVLADTFLAGIKAAAATATGPLGQLRGQRRDRDD